jgi:hypothetical protein
VCGQIGCDKNALQKHHGVPPDRLTCAASRCVPRGPGGQQAGRRKIGEFELRMGLHPGRISKNWEWGEGNS